MTKFIEIRVSVEESGRQRPFPLPNSPEHKTLHLRICFIGAKAIGNR